MVREFEAGVADGRADAVAAFPNRGVGEADHREVGKAERDVNLDVDGIGVHAEDCGTAQAGKHAGDWCKRRVGRAALRTARLAWSFEVQESAKRQFLPMPGS